MDQTCVLMDDSQISFHWAMMGTPCVWFWYQGDDGLTKWVWKCSYLCNFLISDSFDLFLEYRRDNIFPYSPTYIIWKIWIKYLLCLLIWVRLWDSMNIFTGKNVLKFLGCILRLVFVYSFFTNMFYLIL